MREDLEGLPAVIAAMSGVAYAAEREGRHGCVVDAVVYGGSAGGNAIEYCDLIRMCLFVRE